MEKANFYKEFTLRNHGFISEDMQEIIKSSRVLIAGCGSTGGGSVELLVRTGFTQFILTDNGSYELNNINRQKMTLSDIELNKAEVHRSKALSINPHLHIHVDTNGITESNVNAMVEQSDIIIDGVDVTTHSGLHAKYLLHEVSMANKKVVVSGYDMDATQYVSIHDYRKPDEKILRGRLLREDIDCYDPLTTCVRIITPNFMPLGIFRELERNERNEKDFVSQLGIAADLFGVISVSTVVQVLAGSNIKPDVYIDMWEKLNIYTEEDKKNLKDYRKHWEERLKDCE